MNFDLEPMYKRISVIILALSALLALAPAASAATSLGFSPGIVSVKRGEPFTLAVGADPSGANNYTIKVGIKFPADLFEVRSWNYADYWMPLRQSGYEYIDNDRGEIVRTAGYPGGFSSYRDLGALTFLAKKTGTGTIQITSGSIALDENNQNVFGGGGTVSVTVTDDAVAPPAPPTGPVAPPSPKPKPPRRTVVPPTGPVAPPSTSGTAPSEPVAPPVPVESPAVASIRSLEVYLSLANKTLEENEDLVANARFKSAEPEPLPVDAVYSIRDENQHVLYGTTDKIVVEGEFSYNKRFTYLRLPPGKYSLLLSASYSGEARQTARQDFMVKKRQLISYWPWMIILLVVLVFLSVPVLIWRVLLAHMAKRKAAAKDAQDMKLK